MPKQIVLLEVFKDGKKQAETDITHYNVDELGLLLDLQEDMDRTWRYKTTNHEQMKERRESHE